MVPNFKVIFYCFLIFTVLASCTLDQDLVSDSESDEIESRTPAPPSTITTIEDSTNSETSTVSERILVFTKTAGFRHNSIEDGLELFANLGTTNDFQVDQTEDALNFNEETLKQYQLVVFLNTTGNILNSAQQSVFEKYIQSGGSFMGIHSATDTEYNWPWYGQLVGAYFESHPDVQNASINLVEKNHQATEHLTADWVRTDEWYNFKDVNSNINVLLNLDESTYEGGTNGENHPIAWYHEFEGGRSFYTGGGHTEASYDEPDFQQHLLGGILYCLGQD